MGLDVILIGGFVLFFWWQTQKPETAPFPFVKNNFHLMKYFS